MPSLPPERAARGNVTGVADRHPRQSRRPERRRRENPSANRDTEGFCFNLRFDKDTCRWEFDGHAGGNDEDEDALICLLDDFLKDDWSGTATELCAELKKQETGFEMNPAILTKKLKALSGQFRKEFHILIDFERTRSSRRIFLHREPGA